MLNQNHQFSQSLKQKKLFSLVMKKGLHILQLPTNQLKQYLLQRTQENPLLILPELPTEDISFIEDVTDSISHGYDEDSLPVPALFETPISYRKSRFEELISQAKGLFNSKQELLIAEMIIGNLEPNGYLLLSVKELSVLCKVSSAEVQQVLSSLKQNIQPSGVFAASAQETLLLQLKARKKISSLAYKLIADYYDLFLNRKLNIICKKLSSSRVEVQQAIQKDLSVLSIPPLSPVFENHVSFLKPDITIEKDQKDLWIISLADEDLGQIHLHQDALFFSSSCEKTQEKTFYNKYIKEGMEVIHAIDTRNSLLRQIGSIIITHFDSFLEGKSSLFPLTIKKLAQITDVHPSTANRAVKDKYIQTPIGVLPIKSFFTTSKIPKDGNDISPKELLDSILNLVDNEDKAYPLSDTQLLCELKKKGFECSRRSVCKYRKQLHIQGSFQRKLS